MARFVGPFPVIGAVADVHATTALNKVGTQVTDVEGNRFVYMQGVASVVAGTWVSFDEAYVTTRLVANAKGRVAIAMAAIDATTDYGWFCIYGTAPGKALTAFADNGLVYATSTDGSVDDAVVATSVVYGAIGRSAVNETTLLATFELDFPFINDVTTV